VIDMIVIDVPFNSVLNTGLIVILLNDFSRFSDTRVAYYRLVMDLA